MVKPNQPINLANVALSSFAAYRLAYLVSRERGPFDSAEQLRSWVYHRYGDDSWQFAGIQCVLCTSFWFALVVYFLPQTIKHWLGIAGMVVTLHKVLEAADAIAQP